MTEMTLIGLDKLVQLLESPVFSALRLELVQPDTNPELFRSLAGNQEIGDLEIVQKME